MDEHLKKIKKKLSNEFYLACKEKEMMIYKENYIKKIENEIIILEKKLKELNMTLFSLKS